MNIRVIIMDIDGTLTDSNKKIMPKTKEVLLKAQEQGTLLILASGRPTMGLMKYAKELQMDKYHGLLVSHNGARVVDCQTQEVLFEQTMSKVESVAVLEHLKKFNRLRPIIDKDEFMYVNDIQDAYIDYHGPFNVLEYESKGNGYSLCEVHDLASFVDFPLYKILTAADPEYLQTHYQKMMEPFSNLNCMFTGPFYFEYTAQGIDKAYALDCVLRKKGYSPKEMIAFGDGPNDVSMLKYVGMGVAMENAMPEALQAADIITLSNNEEGIAHILCQYF